MALFKKETLTQNDIKFGIVKFLSEYKKELASVKDSKEYLEKVSSDKGAKGLFYKLEKIQNTTIMYTYVSDKKDPSSLIDISFVIVDNNKLKYKYIDINKLYSRYIKPSKKEENNKEDNKTMSNTNLTENAIILKRAKALVESVCEGCEDLKDVKDTLEDVIEKIDDVIDDGKDDKGKKDDDKVDDKTKEVVHEAVTALYEKACLCENAEDATPYIQKAEELQKAIEDIPEETPIIGDDYPADSVSGGKGISNSDAIKELLDGDVEAFKLLTGDDSVKINA